MHERTELDQSEVKITCKAIICCGKVTGGLSRDCFEPGTVEDVCLQGYSRRSQGLKRILTPSVQSSSVTQLCLTLCDPMDCSTPGFPVHHQFPELAQTHIHRVNDAIQPSHPLLLLPSIFPSIRVFLFVCLFVCLFFLQLVSSSYQGAKIMEAQLQHQSFQ